MCGIVAVFGKEIDRGWVYNSTQNISHRGPDDTSFFFSENLGVGFVRLSIIDVDGGRQPIFSEDKTKLIVCNGEIYNYKSLRDLCVSKGHIFNTRSDVEVILHLYEDFGEEGIEFLMGMYAFLIIDLKGNKIVAGRDHIGIKPLFFEEKEGTLFFSSELRNFDLKRKEAPNR